ncbi:MAG: hypothetical protein DI542_10700 [Acinetobacter johnsonii]|uniref:Uncharacterized protein n=2 Tax=Acinetobacter johnsonii TaxID=40214 RepID=A0A2W5RFE8_ACIJO|nr:hypothetical protein RZ95_11510 [Acinetobacter johnsonii XBB1]OFW77727.1 MAG: hypothetical protein A2W44_15115 [Acinetobacter sp. RIFCSPHIGHO2_12_41_5]OHC24413.1 MAG: hypothetical protein A3F63_02470 [Pseudomonadales bacterium RIFCSPHIGHO2_12_FULL_40_16]OOW12864.1 hypothetical protein MF4640_11345 [Acinetobacter sp. MF4640]PZQ88476.1 MAG: hypothetical protein DI542_10700 [Acinetobacter johnsonii]
MVIVKKCIKLIRYVIKKLNYFIFSSNSKDWFVEGWGILIEFYQKVNNNHCQMRIKTLDCVTNLMVNIDNCKK